MVVEYQAPMRRKERMKFRALIRQGRVLTAFWRGVADAPSDELARVLGLGPKRPTVDA